MTALRLLPLFLVLPLLSPATAGAVEHTVTTYKIERGDAVERDERVETWRSAHRAKAVHTDAATGEVLGACTGTRRWISCFDRDPALELDAGAGGRLFVPTWAEAARRVRRALRRGWLVPRELTEHRGVGARRLESTPEATGGAGATMLLVERGTRVPLFRQTRSPGRAGDAVTSTEDVLVRERVSRGTVDFRLNAPPEKRVRRARVGGGR